MNPSGSNRRTSLILFAAAILLAAIVWGAYAWRFIGRETASPAGLLADAGAAEGSTNKKLTILSAKGPGGGAGDRETRSPSEPVLVPSGASSAGRPRDAFAGTVRVNAPPSRESGLQITLSEKKPIAPTEWGNRLELGRSALARGEYVEGRGILSALLGFGLAESDETPVRKELGRLADAMLFSKATNTGDPLIGAHTVAAGESLYAIARREKITEELLGTINQVIDPAKLHVGRLLKVIHGPFRAVIDKSEHRIDIFVGDAYVKSYAVGLGADGGTPTGGWIVNNKLSNPDWTDPTNGRHYLADDPENPIGERWIGLYGVEGVAVGKTGFGIHGTIDPSSIGQDRSMGCIRLAAADVRQVYDLLVLNESQVVVRP